MTNSAGLKIDRAAKHIAELNELFRNKRPFSYVLETNTKTGERATFAKEDKAVIGEAANIAADAIHNLRVALDHAYREIVSPFARTPKEQRAIQFPFSETAARLDEAIKNRLADRVSDRFFQALVRLKPYGEAGGNELLYLIHKLDAIDKHNFPIPSGNYTRIDSRTIRQQVPDFPAGMVNCGFGMSYRDVVWVTRPTSIPIGTLGTRHATDPVKFEKELNVPVDIVFAVAPSSCERPFIPTLHQLVDVAKQVISIIRSC